MGFCLKRRPRSVPSSSLSIPLMGFTSGYSCSTSTRNTFNSPDGIHALFVRPMPRSLEAFNSPDGIRLHAGWIRGGLLNALSIPLMGFLAIALTMLMITLITFNSPDGIHGTPALAHASPNMNFQFP